MRNLCRVSLCLALLAFVTAPVLAQGRPMGGFGGPASLLTNKSVQEELKVTDEQKKKIEDVSKKINDLFREKTRGLGFQDREKFAAATKEVSAEMDKMLPDVLKEDQIKRFKQIRVQQMRVRAFSDEEIQKTLKFTDEQKDAIKKINEEARKTFEEKTKDLGRQDFQKRREIQQEVDKETMGKIAAKLTSDQKKTWKDLTGEPFEVKFERRPPGGGGTRPQPRPDL